MISKEKRRYLFYSGLVLVPFGVVLVLLGMLGTFTIVTCGKGGTFVQNGTSYPYVPLCDGNYFLNFIAEVFGVILCAFGVHLGHNQFSHLERLLK